VSNALAERLAPLQDALAELEREYRTQARADNAPETWAAWSDLQAALMAVRSAQGRDARAAGYVAPAPCEGACCGRHGAASPVDNVNAVASDTALTCTPESRHAGHLASKVAKTGENPADEREGATS